VPRRARHGDLGPRDGSGPGSWAGLADALRGVRVVIDVTNTRATSPDETRAFFGAVTSNLFAAELKAGVEHHVALSIVGVHRISGNGHYAGKRPPGASKAS
jgi:uncharacterized protein YbjT (DUF2867 family)